MLPADFWLFGGGSIALVSILVAIGRSVYQGGVACERKRCLGYAGSLPPPGSDSGNHRNCQGS